MSESRAAYMRDVSSEAKAASLSDNGLLPFQQSFVDAVCRVNHPPDISGAESVPRGNGKSLALRKNLFARSLTPGDPLSRAC